MSAATWIVNELEQKGMTYQEMHHPDAYTAQSVAQCEHVSGHRVAKVVVAMVDGRPVELILPASRRVNLERVRYLLAAKEVRLATEEEIDRYFTDCETGAIPPLRHWDGVEVIMDTSMQVPGDIIFQAGTHRDAVRMRFEDWFRMVNPPVASFSEPAQEASMS
jgi:Ala-tRNA(Pro) deacylase